MLISPQMLRYRAVVVIVVFIACACRRHTSESFYYEITSYDYHARRAHILRVDHTAHSCVEFIALCVVSPQSRTDTCELNVAERLVPRGRPDDADYVSVGRSDDTLYIYRGHRVTRTEHHFNIESMRSVNCPPE